MEMCNKTLLIEEAYSLLAKFRDEEAIKAVNYIRSDGDPHLEYLAKEASRNLVAAKEIVEKIVLKIVKFWPQEDAND